MTHRHGELHGGTLSGTTSEPGGAARTPGARAGLREQPSAERWIQNGILSGIAGAAVVSVFFLVFDLGAGHPFWTPGALGTQLFLGESLAPDAVPSFIAVLSYTLLHGAAFVAAGLMTSFVLLQRLSADREPGPGLGLGLSVGLFLGLELFFLAFLALNAPSLIGAFGAGRIAVANLLAAGAMVAALLGLARLHGRGEGGTS